MLGAISVRVCGDTAAESFFEGAFLSPEEVGVWLAKELY